MFLCSSLSCENQPAGTRATTDPIATLSMVDLPYQNHTHNLTPSLHLPSTYNHTSSPIVNLEENNIDEIDIVLDHQALCASVVNTLTFQSALKSAFVWGPSLLPPLHASASSVTPITLTSIHLLQSQSSMTMFYASINLTQHSCHTINLTKHSCHVSTPHYNTTTITLLYF